MAAARPVQTIAAEVTCSICLELFRDPVTTECGHSFCKGCISQHCKTAADAACPQCQRRLPKETLRPNRELKNIVESVPDLLSSRAVEGLRRGNMCDRHQQPLNFYCKEDQTLLYVACEGSRAHRGHAVFLAEDVVQEYWETIKKHLKGIETIYDKLDQLVSKDRKLLPRGAGEEAHKWLKKLADKTAILFQADRKDQRQRFEDAASQPQPHEPDVPGRKIAMKTELQGRKERGNLRESVAEKKQLTGSHVVRIHEQAPDPKYGLDHRSLDPVIHRISDTTEDAEPKVDVRSARNRFENMISATRPVVSGGSVTGVISPGGKVASQTRLQGPQERGGQVSEEQEGAGTRVCREAETPGPLTRHGSLPPADSHKQVDVTSLRRRFEDSSPPNPSAGSVGRGRGSVSPGRKAAGGVQRP